jgi:hypothetical protein
MGLGYLGRSGSIALNHLLDLQHARVDVRYTLLQTIEEFHHEIFAGWSVPKYLFVLQQVEDFQPDS